MNSGLYEDDFGSDLGSLSDELSPTDGYFSPRQQPRDVFVASPTRSDASDSKSQENAQEALRPSSESRQTYVPHTQSAAGYALRPSESEPLLGGEAPPPTYSAAISTPYNPPATESAFAHDTTMGNPSYHAIAVSGGPQNMADAPDADEDPWRVGPVRPQRGRLTRPRIIKSLLYILGFMIIVSLLVRSFGGRPRNGENPSDEPDFSHPAWPNHCKRPPYRDSGSWTFNDIDNFKLQDPKGVADGKIRFVKAPSSQTSDVTLKVDVVATNSFQETALNYLNDQRQLTVDLPYLTKIGSSSRDRGCMSVEITVSVVDGLVLEELFIETEKLSIDIGPVNMTVQNTMIKSVHGPVHSKHLNSRKTVIDVVSGSISGSYALRDLLSLKSKSGSIGVTVEPKDEDEDEPAPAKFVSYSENGSSNVQFEVLDVPKRDYRVNAGTHSGSLDGTFIHGSTTVLKTVSGSLKADLVPATAKDSGETSLVTTTQSGQTRINVLPSLFDYDLVMKSSHTTRSGSMNLQYPQEWEGDIRGSTGSGSLSLSGSDVDIISRTQHSVHAKKGDGDSSLRFETYSGSSDVTIGDS